MSYFIYDDIWKTKTKDEVIADMRMAVKHKVAYGYFRSYLLGQAS